MTINAATPINNVLNVQTQSAETLPLVFDSPHSGTFYPEDFDYTCKISELRKLVDAHIDDLFSAAPEHNASLLCARFARSYIDPNRSINDIDEHMLKAPWPKDTMGALAPSIRSQQGIGLIAKIVRQGVHIYKRRLSVEEVSHRINNYYLPYHKTLKNLLNQAYKHHGQFWHIDLHSMPSALAYPKHNRTRACDIVLGNHDGLSSSPSFIKLLRDFWEDLGYTVSVNDPFKGAEIIASYGQPEAQRNSVQIEINRALYMDEVTGQKAETYDSFKQHCTQMIAACANYCKEQLNH